MKKENTGDVEGLSAAGREMAFAGGHDASCLQRDHLCRGHGQPPKPAACLSCGVPPRYLLGPQSFFFFQALWGLPVAAHSLDQEHHLDLSSKLVSRYFLNLTLTRELGRWHCVSGGKSGCRHGHTRHRSAVAVCEPTQSCLLVSPWHGPYKKWNSSFLWPGGLAWSRHVSQILFS